MRERYEDMARMREHVYEELDQDKDRLISLEEFIRYTDSAEFQKDDGWKVGLLQYLVSFLDDCLVTHVQIIDFFKLATYNE